MKGPRLATLLLLRPRRLAEADAAYIHARRSADGAEPYSADYRATLLDERERMARESRATYARALALVVACGGAGCATGAMIRLGGGASTVVLGISVCLAVLATLGAVESVTVDGACPIDHAVRWLYRATYGLSLLLAGWWTVSQAFPAV